jgi:hypothetical protein
MESVHHMGVLVIHYVPVLLSKCQILNCIVRESNPGTPCARDNLRGQKSLGPLKMSLEMAHKVIVPQKKIMSRSFLNSGTLIVILYGIQRRSKRSPTETYTCKSAFMLACTCVAFFLYIRNLIRTYQEVIFFFLYSLFPR